MRLNCFYNLKKNNVNNSKKKELVLASSQNLKQIIGRNNFSQVISKMYSHYFRSEIA